MASELQVPRPIIERAQAESLSIPDTSYAITGLTMPISSATWPMVLTVWRRRWRSGSTAHAGERTAAPRL